MKKKLFLVFTALSLYSGNVISQSDISGPPSFVGHTGLLNTWYVGWNAGTNFPLNVEHQGNQPINFSTFGTTRMFIKDANNNYPGGNNGGYVSIGNPPAAAPLFNLSVLTQSVGSSGGGFGGDFLIGGSTTKSPNSFMGLVDVSATANTFVPTYIGSLDAMQQGPAISTVGNIDGAQDLASNNFPVHRFIVGTGFTPYTTGLSGISEINNRVAFTWQNANTIKMMMNANGQLRIGRTLTIPGTLPGNRVEISASAGDPYFVSNNASGLRLTNLTAAKNVVANGTNGVTYQKALSVDGNGDVVLIPSGVPAANQGLTVTGSNVQLGDVCANPAVMNGNRAINWM